MAIWGKGHRTLGFSGMDCKGQKVQGNGLEKDWDFEEGVVNH